MHEIIEKILKEVDVDIKEAMLKDTGTSVWVFEGDTSPRRNYKAYELLHDPARTILEWQAMRDRKQTNE